MKGFKPKTPPINIFGKEYIKSYSSCNEAWNDMVYWVALLYGDWYGNHGANTVAYSYWQYGWQRAPMWLDICFPNRYKLSSPQENNLFQSRDSRYPLERAKVLGWDYDD